MTGDAVVTCGRCRTMFGVPDPGPGRRAACCPQCGHLCRVEADPGRQAGPRTGVLRVTGPGRAACLTLGMPGEYTVGSEGADMEITGDPTVEPEVAVITRDDTPDGVFYRVTALASEWPLMHDNLPLKPGESAGLAYGDSLTAGHTTIIFTYDARHD